MPITSAKAGEIVVARVRGTETYKVKLRLRDNRLHASCTCLYFGPEGEPCKHLWATILATDAKGLLPAAPVRPLQLISDVRYHIQQQPQTAATAEPGPQPSRTGRPGQTRPRRPRPPAEGTPATLAPAPLSPPGQAGPSRPEAATRPAHRTRQGSPVPRRPQPALQYPGARNVKVHRNPRRRPRARDPNSTGPRRARPPQAPASRTASGPIRVQGARAPTAVARRPAGHLPKGQRHPHARARGGRRPRPPSASRRGTSKKPSRRRRRCSTCVDAPATSNQNAVVVDPRPAPETARHRTRRAPALVALHHSPAAGGPSRKTACSWPSSTTPSPPPARPPTAPPLARRTDPAATTAPAPAPRRYVLRPEIAGADGRAALPHRPMPTPAHRGRGRSARPPLGRRPPLAVRASTSAAPTPPASAGTGEAALQPRRRPHGPGRAAGPPARPGRSRASAAPPGSTTRASSPGCSASATRRK